MIETIDRTVYEYYLNNEYDHVANVEGYWLLRDRNDNQVYYNPRTDSISPYGEFIESFRDN